MILKHENCRHRVVETDICFWKIVYFPRLILFGLKAIRISLYSRDMSPLPLITRHLTKSGNLWGHKSDQFQFSDQLVAPLSPMQFSVDPYLIISGTILTLWQLSSLLWLFSMDKPSLFSKSCARNLQFNPITLHCIFSRKKRIFNSCKAMFCE